MEKIKDPHDRYFKAMMSRIDIAREFFLEHLPSWLLDKIDLNSLRICEESFLDKFFKLLKTDILYQVSFRNNEGFIFLHNEHQSKPERFMPFRKLQYAVEIMASYIDNKQNSFLPIVLPIVFYHGKAKYGYSSDLFDLFGDQKELAQQILFQPFCLINTYDIQDKALISQPSKAHFFQWLQKHIFEPDFEPYIEDLVFMLKLPTISSSKDFVSRSLRYFFNSVNLRDNEKYYKYIEDELSRLEGYEMGTLANWFMEKGMQQGMQQGMQRGRDQGSTEATKKIVSNLLKLHVSSTVIAEGTGLSISEVQEIQESLKQQQIDV